jgi:hypothetical protein
MLAFVTIHHERELAMSDTLYCYCCRKHHPKAQMRRFTTRTGERWRCLSSIEAARARLDERDAFGRQQSELNRQTALRLTERMLAPNLKYCLP